MQTLIFGQGGLIGSCVSESLNRMGASVFPKEEIHWNSYVRAVDQIEKSVFKFFVKLDPEDHWSILWLAGKGGFGVSKEQLDQDVLLFENFLGSVAKHIVGTGVVVLASSAGAVYNSNECNTINELSPVCSSSDYGRAKLVQEKQIETFGHKHGCQVLIARISTVYGPGADDSNGYGLINKICRSIVRHEPIDVYVPLETSRNYVYSSDVGEIICRFLFNVFERSDIVSIRNVVSPVSTSVAMVLAECEKICKKRIAYVTRIDSRKTAYGKRFDITSLHLDEIELYEYLPVSSGIQRTLQSTVFDLQKSR